MIQLHNVGFAWPNTTSLVLKNITFHLPKGKLLCICGSNGSGKSTLLQILTGLQHIQQGSFSIGDLNIPGNESALLKKAVLLFQNTDIQLLGSTVEENMLLPWPSPNKQKIQEAQTIIKIFKLENHWSTAVHTLSHGQKQKLNIAAALMLNPELLLLDEPYVGLDYGSVKQLRNILEYLATQNLTRIITTHDLEPIIDITDMILVLHKGVSVYLGPPTEALEMIMQHPEWNIRVPCSWHAHKRITSWEQ